MQKTMKYLSFNKDKKMFEILSRALPVPDQSQTLLKVKAICINRLDLMEKRGSYKLEDPDSIMGIEFVGQKVDPNTLQVLDNGNLFGTIVRQGAYAEYVACRTDHLIDFNYKACPEEFAAIPEAFLTAFQLIYNYSNIKNGDTVYVPAAASGVGTALIQLCKQMKNCKVIASCSGDESKVKLVKELGADLIVNYKEESDKQIQDKVNEFTGGKGVNCVFDCVGPSNSSLYTSILGLDSSWILYGFLGGVKTDNENFMGKVLRNRIRIIASTLRYRSDDYKAQLISDFRDNVKGLLAESKVKGIVGNVFELDFNKESATKVMEDAHKVMETNKTCGRIVVKYA